MADAKISSFASHGAPVGADYVASVLASGPTSKRLLMSDLLKYAGQWFTPGGRLTLESGVPVSTTDQTAKTSVYYTPYVHNLINLWDGANWVPTTFTEKTLALGTITSGLEYNVYGYLSAGALVLELAAWGSATVTFTNATDIVNWTSTPAVDGDMFYFTGGTAPTGLVENTIYYVRDKAVNSFKLASTVGGAAINFTTDGSGTITGKLYNVTLQDGRWCKNGDKTRLLLGVFYTTSMTTTEDSQTKRHLANVYNREARKLFISDFTVHTYAVGAGRAWANVAANTTLAWTFALPSVFDGRINMRATTTYFGYGIGDLYLTPLSGGFGGSQYDFQEFSWPMYLVPGLSSYNVVEYASGGAGAQRSAEFIGNILQ